MYIFFNQKPISEVANDTIVYQTFEINFETKSNTTEIELKIDKASNLVNKITVKATSNKSIIFKYISKKMDNIPFLIHDKDIVNYLSYEDVICCMKFENFLETLTKFNIYLINTLQNTSNFYIAKKVLLEKPNGL